jgi:hypothetical protein
MATQVRCARIAKKPIRLIHVLTRFDTGTLLVEIEDRRPTTSKRTHYYVAPIPADFGKGFRFSKFTCEGGEVYAVNIGDKDEPASCECLGHLRHGHKTMCRHVAAAQALIEAGKLS